MKGMLKVDKATRSKFALDHHRPEYHFLPPMNWMNDPNGLIQWKGIYHLFYQHNPLEAKWGSIHWGHATSLDLLHWEHQPVAMVPELDSPDEFGCWSGVTIVHGGMPVIVYSGNSRVGQRCCLAHSQDDLRTLMKDGRNPVIPDLPDGYAIDEYRDHCLWREGDTWNQLIGARIVDVGGTVLLYRSLDLVNWQFVGPILVSGEYTIDPLPRNAMWECPDLFAVGDKHMLVVSILTEGPQHTGYFLGKYEDGKFIPEGYHRMDYGDWEYYAPQSFVDEAGERIHFGWIQEARSIPWQLEAGWAGVLSLPRRIFLQPDGQVGMQPHPVVDLLRGRQTSLKGTDIPSGLVLSTGITGRALELQAVFSLQDQTKQVGLRLLCSPDGSEYTEIVYDCSSQRLMLLREKSTLDERAVHLDREGDLVLATGEDLHLHVYLDHSVIEVYANERAVLTGRAYPSRKDSSGVALTSQGGAKLAKLHIWEMKSIW
jgi:beta-fructofuranosidase